MKLNILKINLRVFILLILIYFQMSLQQTAAAQSSQKAKNIVIVHGAFADGSGFEELYHILVGKGYHVTIVQNPLTSLEDDVAATNLALNKQDGPVVLVGHSYGGTVITQAGNSPKVVSLVYIEGFQPEVGESTGQLANSEPPSKENGIMPPDENGIIYYSKEKFHDGFTGDLSQEKSDFMYDSQGTISVKCFTATVTIAAWKTKPSYGIVGLKDKSINPSILRKMYKRSGSVVTEINGSHVLYMSHPKEVAKVIEDAALGNR